MTSRATPWGSNRNKELMLSSQADYVLKPVVKIEVKVKVCRN